MAPLTSDGMLVHPRISPRRFPALEHGRLKAIDAIVVHQTDTADEHAVFNDYATGRGVGAHFLIGKNGAIWQTAGICYACHHVGKLLKSKCLTLPPNACSGYSSVSAALQQWYALRKTIDRVERAKKYPDRYPVNRDSIGIELVGKALDPKTYEVVTHAQNDALRWLVLELSSMFGFKDGDVVRHPDVSFKNPGEAATAKWK